MSKSEMFYLFDKCCCRVNVKRGNYIFGLFNIIFRFSSLIPLHFALYLRNDEAEKLILASVFGWLLVSIFTCSAMIVGIWRHQPMYNIPFLITIYSEFLAVAAATVALTSYFAYQNEWDYLILTLCLGIILTGGYCYYSIMLYVTYKKMVSNPLARYIYIS